MPRLIPNHGKRSHVDAVAFKATAEMAADLCLRGLAATNDAFDLGLRGSLEKQDKIISDLGRSLEERSKPLHEEKRRECFSRDFGRTQHLAASTVLTYATLDTVLAEAVRLLDIHCAITAPGQNNRGSSVRGNLRHLRKAMPGLLLLSRRELVVLNEFLKVRNILIHYGYFLNGAIPRGKKLIKRLRASADYGDYFQIRKGFAILLRDYAVRIFVEVCNGLIRRVADGVYRRLLSN